MKLVMAIVNDEDAFLIMDALGEKGFSVTKLASTGGFLRTGNTTLICGVEDEKVDELTSTLERYCKGRKQVASSNPTHTTGIEGYAPYPIEVTVGGGTIFVLNVDEFRKI